MQIECLSYYPKDQIYVVVDATVESKTESLGLADYPRLSISLSEKKKDIHLVAEIWDFLLSQHATRKALLVAVGGGTLTDVVGFAAATYKRGIDIVYIPTTLLSMVDAAWGGKTGFDYSGIKNAIGVFAQPREVLLDASFLSALPAREILSGYAEMIKHALLTGKEILQPLLAHDPLDFDADRMQDMIARSADIKRAIVQKDPTEHGSRKMLNFGHSIGHSLEANAIQKQGREALPHGYYVAYGMIAELYLSHTLLGLDKSICTLINHYVLEHYGRPTCSCKDYAHLIDLMHNDKKNTNTQSVSMTLLKDMGDPALDQQITDAQIMEALDYLFSL